MNRNLLALAVLTLGASLFGGSAWAQSPLSGQLDQGFKVRVPAFPTGAERTRQPGLWMLDVDLKKMRMRYLELEDPKTGEVSKQQVWYLVYRIHNRPIRGATVTASVDPVNELDTPLTRPLFIPEITMITYEDPTDEIPDQTIVGDIVPMAVNKLRPIEERLPSINLNGAIQAVQPLPEASEDSQPLYGVAIFRNVNPETDFFKVIFRGFTNAYELRESDGENRVWRKVLVQRFKRPGDRFDPNQDEFDFVGNPQWLYVPDDVVNDVDVIAAKDDLKPVSTSDDSSDSE